MSKEIIKEDIIQLLESIIEQTQTIDAYNGTIPQIELDLVQDNIRQLYQNYVYLNKINQGQPLETGTVRKEKFEKKTDEEVEDQKEEQKQEVVSSGEEPPAETEEKDNGEQKESAKAEEKEVVSEEATKEKEQKTAVEEKQEEPIAEKKEEIKEESGEQQAEQKQEETVKKAEPEKKKNEPRHKKEPEPEKEAETQHKITPEKKARKVKKEKEEATKDLFSEKPSTLAEKLQGSGTSSLYDRIGVPGKEGTLGERLKRNPVTDIKKAIGINEKFLFINELFQGNMHDYNDAIKRMNRAENLQEAAKVFDEYKEKYNWNAEASATLQLLDFVERKFQ